MPPQAITPSQAISSTSLPSHTQHTTAQLHPNQLSSPLFSLPLFPLFPFSFLFCCLLFFFITQQPILLLLLLLLLQEKKPCHSQKHETDMDMNTDIQTYRYKLNSPPKNQKKVDKKKVEEKD